MTSKLRIDIYAEGGTDFVRSLHLTQEQCEVVTGWIKADIDRLAAPVEPFEIAMLDGKELWHLPDAELSELFNGSWASVIYTKLVIDIPFIGDMLEARFGEKIAVDMGARMLDRQGLNGDVYRDLTRQERIEFDMRRYADAVIPMEH